MITAKEERRPLHARVREHLRAEYLTGSREALPSLRELSQKLEINHATISRALRDLEVEGVVEIVPRKGVFPTGKTIHPVLVNSLNGNSASAEVEGEQTNHGVNGVAHADAKQNRDIEMVVLYDNTHGQLDVAQPIFCGMEHACEMENNRVFNDGDTANGSFDEARRLTRSIIPITPIPDAATFVAQAKAKGIAGVVFLGFGYLEFPESMVESRFIFEVSRQMPVVLAGTPHAQLPLDCVYCDPRPQMREFLDECYASGLRRYEFFGSGTAQPHQLERHEEFCHFLMKNGLTWNREFLEGESTEALTDRLRELPELPEVVVATNMNRAICVALEAQRRGLSLPNDLKLLCFASLERDAQPLLPYANILLMDEPQVGVHAWNALRKRLQQTPEERAAQTARCTPPVNNRVPARFISRH
jgi:DNA-binding LacI/PurR family transcriptional regulator/DNA-binding transcriptional regulator YhcF (GntR family)